MKNTPLRVGVLAHGFRAGTGPATYFAAVQDAMAGEQMLCRLDGPCSHGLDLVHVIDAKRVRPGLLDSFRVPLVVDFHDDYWTGFTPYPSPDLPLRWLRQKQLYRHHLEVIKRAGAIVVHSGSVASSLQRVLENAGKPSGSPGLFTVPYGINPQRFATEEDRALPSQGSPPLILFAGRDLFRKGLPVMVKALPRVLEMHPQARLVVIGREYWHSRIAARLISQGLPVEFLAEQSMESLIEWYARASLLVLPSRQEAFGIVLIEAMAAGLPVVAARTGGIPEAVEDNVSGLLHRPGDPFDLADKINRVLDDPELRKRLIEAGKQRAGTFSLENMKQGLERAYLFAMESG